MEWIRCDERLPENSDTVAVLVKYGCGVKPVCGFFIDGSWIVTCANSEMPDESFYDQDEILCWVELPPPTS